MKYRIAIAAVALLFTLQAQDAARTKASDYPSPTTAEGVEIGAEYMVHSIPGPRGGYFAKEYLVVEVAIFPAARQSLKISSGHFTLRVNNKSNLTAQSSGSVAAALKYPDWEQRRNMTAQAGPLIFGAPPAVGRFPGDPTQPRPLPNPVPDQTDTSGVDKEPNVPIEDAIARAALPEGPTVTPVKGCIFFRFEGKLKSIKSLDLIYDVGGKAPQARIRLI